MRTFDDRRAGDLERIAGCVDSFAQQFERMPENLAELEQSSNLTHCAYNRYDPETKAPYEYFVSTPLHVGGVGNLEGSFELCATFALEAHDETYDARSSYYNPYSKWYEHPAGRDCDTLSVVVSQDTVPLGITPIR